LIDWFPDLPIDWLINSPICQLIDWFISRFANWLMDWFDLPRGWWIDWLNITGICVCCRLIPENLRYACSYKDCSYITIDEVPVSTVIHKAFCSLQWLSNQKVPAIRRPHYCVHR
jgi:hypothetical protein